MAPRKKDIRVDTLVRTNARLAKKFGWDDRAPLRGRVLAPYSPIAGCWRVQVAGARNPMYIHEKFLEIEQ